MVVLDMALGLIMTVQVVRNPNTSREEMITVSTDLAYIIT